MLGLITLYVAAHCRVVGTTYMLPTPQGYDAECCPVKVAVRLCRHVGVQFDSVAQIPCTLNHCGRKKKKQSALFLCSKAGHEVSLRQVSYCLSTLRFVFLFAGRTVPTMGENVVGWGTALQAGRSRVRFPIVSFEFFIDIILPAALWSWGQLSL